MDPVSIVTIFVALIAAGSAYASARAAAKSTTNIANTSSRTDMEKDAYNRARTFDTDTITRQDLEIIELRTDNRRLHIEVTMLRRRFTRLERGLAPDDDDFHERAEDIDPLGYLPIEKIEKIVDSFGPSREDKKE